MRLPERCFLAWRDGRRPGPRSRIACAVAICLAAGTVVDGALLPGLVGRSSSSVAHAAPLQCRDDAGWHVCYQSTATDGLRVSGVTFDGQPVLSSGSLPQIDVAYTGFTLLDELGTTMVPPVGDLRIRSIDGGFEMMQNYEMAAWPQCGTYRYEQSWRFYQDGRMQPFVTIYGPGVEGPHMYRVYWRLELTPGGPGGDSFEQWTGRWDAVGQESRLAYQPPLSPEGSKWRVVENGAGWSMGPASGDQLPKLWALSKNPSQGEIDLPAQRTADFPDQWLNGEGVQSTSLALWYEMSIFKGTNCDQTMQVGSGPLLRRELPPPPSPTPLPPTAKAPTPTVVLPTPGPTPEGASSVAGRVELQGRDAADGVILTVDGTPEAVTGPDGRFEILGVAPGTHTLAADPKGYLCTEREVQVEPSTRLEVPAVTLGGGDIVADGVVNILDLAAIGAEYGNAAPQGSRADVNLDGAVGLLDLVLVSSNYGRECPTDW